MKITCQSCGSKYTVSDEKVQGKTVKIKCRKCSATIMVNSSGAVQQNGAMAEPVSHGSDAAEAAAGGTFTVNVAEGDQRTMSLPEIIDAYNASVVTAETYVWADGMADWQPLGQVDAIVSALHAAASQPPPAAAEPEPMPSPVAAAPAYAAVPTPATSLGNQIPSEPYAAAAAAPRAAARREPRAARDLFGGGGFGQEAQPVADDIATSAPLFSAAAAVPAAPQPGQRDENSVLFSLSALTAKAGAAPVSSPSAATAGKTTATKDDSGLIDLRALSANASAPAPSNLVPDNAALFPLGMPAPATAAPGPSLAIPTEAPQQKNRTGLFVGLGLVVALAAMAGAFMAMKGGEDKPPPTTEQTAAAPVPTPTPAPTPTPEPTAEASAAPTTSASAPTAVAGAPKGNFKPGGNFGKPGASPPPGKPPAAAPAPAAKPAGKSNCNCPPGDLMCAMKCSTK